MKSVTTERFRKAYQKLPEQIRNASIKAYKLWDKNPKHPSLQFKKIHRHKPIYSIRVSIGWRALGVIQGDTIIWFWIGSHSEYDNLIKEMT